MELPIHADDDSAMKDGGRIEKLAGLRELREPHKGCHLIARQRRKDPLELTVGHAQRKIRRTIRVVGQASQYRFGTAEEFYFIGFAPRDLPANQVNGVQRAGGKKRSLISGDLRHASVG
jgi:hypothetical protein